MPFWSGEWGQSMDGCIRWGGDRLMGRGSFVGKCGASASYCSQWGLGGIVILGREGWRRRSSQITLEFVVILMNDYGWRPR